MVAQDDLTDGQGDKIGNAAAQKGDKTASHTDIYNCSFDELYNLVMEHMSKGKHPVLLKFGLTIPGQPVQDSGMIMLSTQEEASDISDCIHMLMCQFDESLGRLLASYPAPDVVRQYISKLEVLYGAAKRCEEQVEAVNKPARDRTTKLLKGFFSTTAYSMEIRGCQLVLEGYLNPEPQVSIDDETRKLYEISGIGDNSRLETLVQSIDLFVKGIGQLINSNADGSKSWYLSLLRSVSYHLKDQNFEYWERALDTDSPEHRTIDDNGRKIWVCYNLINGYMKGKYKEYESERKMSEEVRLQQKAEIDKRFSPELEERLTETLKNIYDGRVVSMLIPSILNRYLLSIGIERGKHYV